MGISDFADMELFSVREIVQILGGSGRSVGYGVSIGYWLTKYHVQPSGSQGFIVSSFSQGVAQTLVHHDVHTLSELAEKGERWWAEIFGARRVRVNGCERLRITPRIRMRVREVRYVLWRHGVPFAHRPL